MKFKRLLAAILSTLMITSCMSFVAGAQEAEAEAEIDAIEEIVAEEAEEEAEEAEEPEEEAEEPEEETEEPEESEEVAEEEATLAEEADTDTEGETATTGTGVIVTFTGSNGGIGDGGLATKTQYYDAVNDVVFWRVVNTDTYELQWNTYTFGKPKVDEIDNTVNAAYRMRSNTPAKPVYKLYQGWMSDEDYVAYLETGKTDENGKFGGGTFYGETTNGDENWETTTAAFTPVNGDYNLEYFNQVQTYLAGNSDKPAGAYFDVAIAVIANDEASAIAKAEDASSYSSGYKISFSLNYTGAEELTAAPAENPTRDGFNFKGWSTNKYAASGEMDLTCLTAVPTADTTYYAIWDNATIKFNRRNGASHVEKIDGKDTRINDTVTTLYVGVGEVIPFPEAPTYKSHEFLGWSTEKNNAEEIIDTANVIVTQEMVESGMTYYAVWKSIHDSTQPVFIVNAQNSTAYNKMVGENCLKELKYDAENDVVYAHYYRNPDKEDASARCNMYSLNAVNLQYTTDADTLYLVVYLRTNITGNSPYINLNSTTNKDGTVSAAFSQKYVDYVISNESDTPEWQKIVLPLKNMSELGIATHMDFFVVGDKVLGETDYFDISEIVIFDNEAAALNYDIDAASEAERITVSYDTYGGSAVEAQTYINGKYTDEKVTFPEAIPTKENYTFKGWANAQHGSVLTSVDVPDKDTTYYAVWEMAEPSEAGDKLYLSDNGCDTCNNGFSATYPVKTLKKANDILAANENINTIVVVGTYSKKNESAAATNNFAKNSCGDITITGYDENAVFDMRYNPDGSNMDSHFRINAKVTFENIKITGSAKDGGIMSQGYELTFGEGVTVEGNQNIGFIHYDAQYKDGGVINLLSGTFNKVDIGVQSGATYSGTSTINIGGTASTKITNGHGHKGKNHVYGISNVNINGGNVSSIQLTSTAETAVTSYAGLRYYTINAGTVGNIYTTGSSVSKKYDSTEQTADVRAGVTVFEINGGTVGTIALGTNRQTSKPETDDATRVVILNNGMEATVEDPDAIVVKTTSAKLSAVTNAHDAEGNPTYGTYDNATADWGKGIKLTGFSFTTDKANIYLNGKNYPVSDFVEADDDAALADETVSGIIPAELFNAGENTAIFSEAPLYTITWKNGTEVVKTELVAEGTTPTAPVIEEYGKALSWDPEITAVTGDATYTAVWTEATVQNPVKELNSLQIWTYLSDSERQGTNTTLRGWRYDAIAQRPYMYHTHDGSNNEMFIRNNGSTNADKDDVTVTNGAVYVAMDIRSTIPLTPKLTLVDYVAGGEAGNGWKHFYATEATKGNGEWERVVIKIGNFGDNAVENLTEFTRFNLAPLGDTKNGASVDIFGLAFFNDEYSANEYVLSPRPNIGTYKFTVDGEEVTPDIENAPEKTGYTFKGWTPDGGEKVYENTAITAIPDLPTGEVTLVALFEANTYTITFVDGVDTYEVPTKYDEMPVAPVLTKAGHDLSWTPELATVTGEATYTAVWTAKKYNVIYELDGEEYNKAEVTYGTEVTILAAPEAREGYTFSGWKIEGEDAASFTMPDADVTITGTFTVNKYTVTYKVDGEVYGEVETYDYNADVTMREAPTKDGYTFSGWNITITKMPAENVEIIGTFTKNEVPFPTTPTYNTYGKYDSVNGTYTVELKFSGAKVNQGSFGFNFPTAYMTFKSVTANAEAGIELLPEGGETASPIYANGEGNYANTWAAATIESAGNIDATEEEVLIATFVFEMTKEQRTAFEAALASESYKFDEYVVETPNAKYHNGSNYLVTIYDTGLAQERVGINYASHTDEEVTPEIKYTTYGKYDAYNGTYTIDIKVKGAKINLGAFGLAFNSAYMTFDPAVDEYGNAINVTMADNVANYLNIILNNTEDGYAFAFDGSSMTDGYVDASEEEALIATIKLTMSPEQRTAFVEAGKTMSIFVPTANDSIDATTLAKYYDGENYLVSLYMPGLATPKVAAEYAGHTDEELPVTLADVEVTVEFTDKDKETGTVKANIATIKLGDEDAIALEAVGDTANTVKHTFKALTIGETYTITVEKNGYLAGTCEITVVEGENTVEMKLFAGDIKGAADDACGDGTVDLSDFVRLIRAFDEEAENDFKDAVDIDESGSVNVSDLSIIKANYNKTSADNTITINGVSNSEEAAG